nr:CpsB/CapC family capsule biosynthesis tyrosine phosphatase [Acidaminococcus fermentans]
MIDIHSHILYDIPGDDGARDRSMSLDMLRQAAEAGTRELFAPPFPPPGHLSLLGRHHRTAGTAPTGRG